MDYQDLTKKTDADIQTLLSEERERLRELNFRASEGQLKTVRDIRKIKKTIAQIQTDVARRKQAKAE